MPRISGLVVSLLALVAPTLAGAANSWDDFTYITFSAPVEIPGHALPAGTYRFQVADIWSNLDTIEIYSTDGTLVARVATMPMYRFEPVPQHTVIQFEERPSNSPTALSVWFPRGQRWGHRFVYAKRHRAGWSQTLGTRP